MTRDLLERLAALAAAERAEEGLTREDAEWLVASAMHSVHSPRVGAMTPAETARALVAHPRWEWRPGMRLVLPGRAPLLAVAVESDVVWMLTLHPDPDDIGGPVGLRPWALGAYEAHGVPDLSDPATAGVLLAMVLEALGDTGPGLGLEWLPNGRARLDWYDGEYQRTASGDTLGHAAGLALLALWGGE